MLSAASASPHSLPPPPSPHSLTRASHSPRGRPTTLRSRLRSPRYRTSRRLASPRAATAAPTTTARPRIRRRRLNVPLTAEAARRAVINVAEERVDVLKELVQEVRDIKQLLSAVVTPRDEP